MVTFMCGYSQQNIPHPPAPFPSLLPSPTPCVELSILASRTETQSLSLLSNLGPCAPRTAHLWLMWCSVQWILSP